MPSVGRLPALPVHQFSPWGCHMSSVQAVAAPASIKANEVLVSGRIDDVRDWESGDSAGYVTRLRLPAADEYSSAATIEVSSRRKLGKAGEEIRVHCRLGGFLKRGKGQNGSYELVNMRLTVIE